jgi:hypothetical protein
MQQTWLASAKEKLACFCAACVHFPYGAVKCRTLSLLDECKRSLAESGQATALLPFLTSKKDVIRWMARQVGPLLPGQLSSLDVDSKQARVQLCNR